jgi:anti-anti-sigma factor
MGSIEIAERKVGDALIVEPTGSIDTRTFQDLDSRLLALFKEGNRLFVLDFSNVEFISSAGIRVLVKLTKMLGGSGLALCGLNDQVATVLDIAGFAGFFTIASDRRAAIAKLEELKRKTPPTEKDARPPKDGKLVKIAQLLLGESDDEAKPAGGKSPRGAGKSELSSHVERLLSTEDS